MLVVTKSISPAGDHQPRRAAGDDVILHRGLAGGRWETLTLAKQLGNAGSDVGRAIRARTSGDRERFAPALDRALELLYLTLVDLALAARADR